MRNIALRVEYDGTGFAGSQYQQQKRTVQAELEAAWHRFSGEKRRWTLAGRTDAGVHALGQVANIHTESGQSLVVIRQALNALLPQDIIVHDVWEAVEDFHARFSAQRREYRFLILNHATPSALLRQRVVHIRQPLDITAMQEALSPLVGENDFAAFAGGGHEVWGGKSTVRICYHVDCTLKQLGSWPVIQIDMAANGFLRHMVRNIVGTVLLVGAKRLDPEAFKSILDRRERRLAGPTAPPHGLYLTAVLYDPSVVRQNLSSKPKERIDDQDL